MNQSLMINYVKDQVREISHEGGHRNVAIRQSMLGRQHGTCIDPLPCVSFSESLEKWNTTRTVSRKL